MFEIYWFLQKTRAVADVHSKTVRSFNMSQIKGKNTKPELIVRKFLFAHGYRFRLNDKRLPGKPDIVLPKYRTAIFVHGCFWHGHDGCKYFVVPKTRTEWWNEKIEKNKKRDIVNVQKLKEQEWKVISIYECKLRPLQQEKTLKAILKYL